MDCRVVVEAAVPVYDVETVDEAVHIAIAKTGEMLNPDLSYVDIEMGDRTSPGGEALPPAFVAADEALVALELEMTAFNVESSEHADRIARTEIGERLEGVPLKVLDTERVSGETDDGDETDGDEGADGETDSDETKRGETDGDEGGDGRTTNAGGDQAGVSGSPADGEAGASGDENDAESGGDEKDDGESKSEDENREEADGLLPEFEEMVDENRR